MSLYFETGGFLTSIQDGGRFGYQDIGVSPSGPMDKKAFNIANLLVGNPKDESAFELTYMGPVILFESDNVIAITGADMSPTLDGVEVPLYQAVSIRQGQRLRFAQLKSGLRSYIAVSGGLDVPKVMGSRSTLIRNHIGGYKGRTIQKDDRVPLRSPRAELRHMGKRKLPSENSDYESIVLRVIRGPQDKRFSDAGIKTFFSEEYSVSHEFDRMGCRLEGAVIEHKGDANIISDGIAEGSVQVPGNGLPIIMLADRQSTGGYTKIATVISVDLSKMAQVKPGSKIRFKETDIRTAQRLYVKELKKMRALESKWIRR